MSSAKYRREDQGGDICCNVRSLLDSIFRGHGELPARVARHLGRIEAIARQTEGTEVEPLALALTTAARNLRTDPEDLGYATFLVRKLVELASACSSQSRAA